MKSKWIELNDHCKRKYIGNDCFVDCETVTGLRPQGYKYALYKSGAGEPNFYGVRGALFIRGASTLKELSI